MARQKKIVFQNESAECALACLSMILTHYDQGVSLDELRKQYGTSSRGMTLKRLIEICDDLSFDVCALRTELDYFSDISDPVIVHWDFVHFVVVTKVRRGIVEVLDPASGRQFYSLEAFGQHYTGVALELSPRTKDKRPQIPTNLNLAFFRIPAKSLLGTLISIVVISLAFQALGLLPPLLVQIGVDTLVPRNDKQLLLIVASGLIAVVLLQSVIMALRGTILIRIGRLLQYKWMHRLVGHTVKLPLEFLSRRDLGDILSRFSSIDAVQRTLTNVLSQFFFNIVTIIVTFTLMLFYSWKLTLVAVSFIAIFMFIQIPLSRIYSTRTEQEIAAGARAHGKLIEIVRGVATIRMLEMESDREMDTMNAVSDRLEAGIRRERVSIFSLVAQHTISSIENIIVLSIGFVLSMNGSISLGMLLAFVAFKGQFAAASYGIFQGFLDFSVLRMHLSRIAEITSAERDRTLSGKTTGLGEPSGQLKINGLGFRYSKDDPWVFRDVSFALDPEETVALVGQSGCGKSTLFKVLLGLLPATEGHVTVGGVPLRESNWSWIRSWIGVVLQDDWIFGGRIVDNIVPLGQDVDYEQMRRVCDIACIRGDIETMPMAYFTFVGEAGLSLSAGQRQRLMLARALYRNPKILFLDEFTSFLDTTTESRIVENLESLKLTQLIIAHRPETISRSDRVINLNSEEFRPRPENAIEI